MQKWLGLLAIVLVVASVAAVPTTSVSGEDLVDTRLCWFGKVCTYTADVNIKLKEKAVNGAGQIVGSTARLELSIDFNISSVRGSASHEYFRLDVVQYFGGETANATAAGTSSSSIDEMRRFPLFFTQNKATGVVDGVFLSSREKRAMARFKTGLIRSLVNKIPKSAIVGNNNNNNNNATYVVHGRKGQFVSDNQLSRDARGNLQVLEETHFIHTTQTGKRGRRKSTSAAEAAAATRLDTVRQSRRAQAHLTADGHLQTISSRDVLSIGSVNTNTTSAAIEKVPSTGKSKFLVLFDAHFVEAVSQQKNNKKRNYSPIGEEDIENTNDSFSASEEEIQTDLQSMLGGVERVSLDSSFSPSASSLLDMEDAESEHEERVALGEHTKAKVAEQAAAEHTPGGFGPADEHVFKMSKTLAGASGDEDDEDLITVSDPAQALLRAEQLLSSSSSASSVNVRDLIPLVKAGASAALVNHARSLYQDGSLSATGMKTVLGALSSKRSPESYDALLNVLHDNKLPVDIRRQAVVSLLHTESEPSAPAFVVRSVADLAFAKPSATTPMTHEATLLLGALLSGRSDDDSEMRGYMNKLQNELQILDPENSDDADRAVAVLGALGNSDAIGASPAVLRFVDSPVERVRVAAVDALRSLRAAESSDSSAAASSASDLEEDEEDASSSVADGSSPVDDAAASALFTSLLDVMDDAEEDQKYASAAPAATNEDEDEDDETSSSSSINFLDVGDSVTAAGQSRELLNRYVTLVGGANLSVRIKARNGAKWSSSSAGGYGSSSIKANIGGYKRRILRAGYHGSIKPIEGENAVGSTGRLNVYLDVAGKRILNYKLNFSPKDLHTVSEEEQEEDGVGSFACPVSALDPRVVSHSVDKTDVFSRELIHIRRRYLLGPVPIKVDYSVAGTIGSRVLFSAFLNCATAKNPSDIAVITGVVPIVHLSLKTSARADAFVAVAGVASLVHLVNGEVPSYSIVTSSSACSAVDLDTADLAPGSQVNPESAQSSLHSPIDRVALYAKAVKKSWSKPLVNSASILLAKSVASECSAVEAGDFIAGHVLKAAVPVAVPVAVPAATTAAPASELLDSEGDDGEEELLEEQPAATPESIVNVAHSQLGVCEATGHNDGVPATRYAEGRQEPWCGDFVAWVFRQAGHALPGVQRSLAGVGYMETQLKQAKVFHNSIPQAGDIIFFTTTKPNGKIDRHVGIVASVDATLVHTIEGNSGNCVRERSYPIHDKSIDGYARPVGLLTPADIETTNEYIQRRLAGPISDLSETYPVIDENSSAEDIMEAQQRAAQAAQQASSSLQAAANNAYAIRMASQQISNVNKQGVEEADRAREVSVQAQAQDRAVAGDSREYLGTPKSDGVTRLSSNLRSSLDGAADSINQVGREAQTQGQRTRDAVNENGRDERKATRNNGYTLRQTERKGAAAVEAEVEENGEQSRKTVRSEASASRKTVRDQSQDAARDIQKDAKRDRNLERRSEGREEASESTTRKNERSSVKALESEMGEVEKKEEDHRLRDMFRRQMGKVEEKDNEVENMIRRREDRDRMKRVEDDEARRMKSVKDTIRREDMKQTEQRSTDRLDQDTRRRFDREDQKDRFKSLDKDMQRDEDLKGFERRKFGQVEDRMRREDSQKADSDRLSRFENRVEKDADNTAQLGKDISGVEKDIKSEGKQSRDQQRRDASKIEGQVDRQSEREQSEAQGEKTRDLLRREDTDRKQSKTNDKLSSEIQTESQKARSTIRKGAKSVNKEQRRQAQSSKRDEEFASVRKEERREGREDRQEAREQGQEMSKSISDAENQSSRDQQIGQIEEASKEAADSERRADSRTEKAVEDSNKEMTDEQAQAGREMNRAQRRNAQEMESIARNNKKGIEKELSRDEKQRKSFFNREQQSAQRHRRDIRSAIKDLGADKKQFEDHVKDRMARSSERNQLRNTEEQDRMRRRMDRQSSQFQEQEKLDQNHLTRELARRSMRTNGRLAAVANSASKRVSRLESREDARFARESGRRRADNEHQLHHFQRRMSRDDARDSKRVQDLRRHTSNRAARLESREAGSEAALAQKFGLRMGDSQKAFNALAKG